MKQMVFLILPNTKSVFPLTACRAHLLQYGLIYTLVLAVNYTDPSLLKYIDDLDNGFVISIIEHPYSLLFFQLITHFSDLKRPFFGANSLMPWIVKLSSALFSSYLLDYLTRGACVFLFCCLTIKTIHYLLCNGDVEQMSNQDLQL